MPTETDQIDLTPIDNLDPTIHSPSRLKIMVFLSAVEGADFTFLLRQTGLTRGNLSVNLRKLEEAGYLNIKKEFVDRIPRTLATLTEDGKAALRKYQVNMRTILEELL